MWRTRTRMCDDIKHALPRTCAGRSRDVMLATPSLWATLLDTEVISLLKDDNWRSSLHVSIGPPCITAGVAERVRFGPSAEN